MFWTFVFSGKFSTVSYPYPELRLRLLTVATAAGILWKISFSKYVKKKSQSKDKLEKIKLESKKLGSFQMYENSWKNRLPLLFIHFKKKIIQDTFITPLNKLNENFNLHVLWNNFTFLSSCSRVFQFFFYFVGFFQNTCSFTSDRSRSRSNRRSAAATRGTSARILVNLGGIVRPKNIWGIPCFFCVSVNLLSLLWGFILRACIFPLLQTLGVAFNTPKIFRRFALELPCT